MSILGRNRRKNLNSLLKDQVAQFQEAGGAPAEVISALYAYKKIISRRLVTQFAVFLVLLVVSTYTSVSLFSDQSALAAVVVAGLGVVAGLITNLFGTWRELDRLNLILILIRGADDEQIKTVLDKLIDKL